MNRCFGRQHASGSGFRIGPNRRSLAMLSECWRGITGRNEVQGDAILSIDTPKLGIADAHRILQHGLKHRLKIAGELLMT